MINLKGSIYLYSTKKGEIQKFLNSFFNQNIKINNDLKWNIQFENPIEMNNLIGTFIENNDKFQMNMWISIDKGVYINITEYNADKIIRYIYERFPY